MPVCADPVSIWEPQAVCRDHPNAIHHCRNTIRYNRGPTIRCTIHIRNEAAEEQRPLSAAEAAEGEEAAEAVVVQLQPQVPVAEVEAEAFLLRQLLWAWGQ